MIAKETVIKLIRQELGASPDSIKAISVHNGTAEMYLTYVGKYTVIVTAREDETLQLSVLRRSQCISTYHNAQTLKEDKTRTQIERRAAHAETVRNEILNWCKQVYDDLETLLQAGIDDVMNLGLYPNPGEDGDCT